MFKTFEFLNFLKEEFPGTLDTHFAYDMAENAINYVESVACEYDDWKNQFVQEIVEIIPEITEDDVLRFFEE